MNANLIDMIVGISLIVICLSMPFVFFPKHNNDNENINL